MLHRRFDRANGSPERPPCVVSSRFGLKIASPAPGVDGRVVTENGQLATNNCSKMLGA